MILWIYFFILIELAVVSWIDVRTKKISNLWFIFNLLLAVVFHYFYQESYPWQLTTLFFPVIWLLAGFGLYWLEIMGAGDSKYLSSLFFIIPLEHQGLMFEKIIYSTCVVGFVMLSIKFLKDFQKIKAYAFSTYWKGVKESIRSSFSYAPVIFLAWILFGIGQWK